ncbi:HD domain-containing protein [Zongyangia hominis]|uniref:HD domain-containing protein n=1 Tax=Zongyangia hominis TaxID=2763677 RepID=A0A926EGB3_9FIRM|nr:HD domain-containing protein [Zongyangia hominis]MBC8571167.1 HD domain-containing protein [Zongyangia hominis]
MKRSVFIATIIKQMADYDKGSPKHINHFLKVFSYARTIGILEGLDKKNMLILETAAVLHDIGINVSKEKYDSSAGHYQELEGPPIAKEMLKKLGASDSLIHRVCYLIGHHHTYSAIEGMDYQILVEADFLVNCDEEQMTPEQIATVRSKYFRTKTGKRLLDDLFPPEPKETDPEPTEA